MHAHSGRLDSVRLYSGHVAEHTHEEAVVTTEIGYVAEAWRTEVDLRLSCWHQQTISPTAEWHRTLLLFNTISKLKYSR